MSETFPHSPGSDSSSSDRGIAHLTLITSGLCTLLVDHGRPHSRSLGIPLGGAADRFSLALGNALLGNAPESPALEVTLQGPKVVADGPLACVLFGAPFELRRNDEPLKVGHPFLLRPQETLSIGGAPEGARAYLCVAGGLWDREILGSHSSMAPLTPKTVLKCQASEAPARRFLDTRFEWNREPHVIRILPGPQRDWFESTPSDSGTFTISKLSNRMGIRLEGEPLQVPNRELVSEPVCPGSIQVTREGQCIILGVDGQTIGGYPKIAQVASVDLDKLAQWRPGETIRMEWIGPEAANRLRREKEAELAEWLLRLRVSLS